MVQGERMIEAPVRLMAVSGSLRARSANMQLIRACARLAPPGVDVHVFDGLSALPFYNPDMDDAGEPPESVAYWRTQIGLCGGILISSPDYAGVPGVLKNALDWLLGGV